MDLTNCVLLLSSHFHSSHSFVPQQLTQGSWPEPGEEGGGEEEMGQCLWVLALGSKSAWPEPCWETGQ